MNEVLTQIQSLLAESRKLASEKAAPAALEKALAARTLALGLPDGEPATCEARGAAAQEAAVLFQRANDPARALEHFREAETALAGLPPSPTAALMLAATRINVGGLLTRERLFDEAHSTLTAALAGLDEARAGAGEANAPAVAVMTLTALQNKAAVELERREMDAGKATLMAALELGESVIGSTPQLLSQVVNAAGQLIQVAKATRAPELATSTAERAARWAEAAHAAGAPQGLQLYVTTRFQLVDASTFVGRFAEAESELWKALDVASTPQTLMLGADFYFTLLRLTDEQLEAGDLPREEIAEALSEILDKVESAQAPPALMELLRGRYSLLAEGDEDLAEEILERASGATDAALVQLRGALKAELDWRKRQRAGV